MQTEALSGLSTFSLVQMLESKLQYQNSDFSNQNSDFVAAQLQESFLVVHVRDRERENHQEVTLMRRDVARTTSHARVLSPTSRTSYSDGLALGGKNQSCVQCLQKRVRWRPTGWKRKSSPWVLRKQRKIAHESLVNPGLQRFANKAAHATFSRHAGNNTCCARPPKHQGSLVLLRPTILVPSCTFSDTATLEVDAIAPDSSFPPASHSPLLTHAHAHTHVHTRTRAHTLPPSLPFPPKTHTLPPPPFPIISSTGVMK